MCEVSSGVSTEQVALLFHITQKSGNLIQASVELTIFREHQIG